MQKYLVLKGIAGLGNRLCTLANAIGYAQKTGRILLVDEGDNVKKGQILAYLSSTDRAAILDAVRANPNGLGCGWEGLRHLAPADVAWNGVR